MCVKPNALNFFITETNITDVFVRVNKIRDANQGKKCIFRYLTAKIKKAILCAVRKLKFYINRKRSVCMKKGLKVCVNLSLLVLFGSLMSAQPSSMSVETFVLDNFDTENEWKWTVNASRFVAEGYPKLGFFEGIPNSLKPFYKDSEQSPKVLGVNVAFNRKGDNWIEVLPTKDGKPYECPLTGVVRHFDFWVWGTNYNYSLDVLVRDANGSVHILPCGTLNFRGWRNFIIKVPTWMQQSSRLRTGPKGMAFVGFRVKTHPREAVDDFAIYFDQLKYMASSLSFIYDGYELRYNDFGSAETVSSGEEGAK